MNSSPLESKVLGRDSSFFEADVEREWKHLEQVIGGSRILVIGAAGSIGGAFVRVLVGFRPSGLWLADPNENNLVEVVRDLRSSGETLPDDFGTVAIGFGSPEFSAFIGSQFCFDYVLNFAALKHVRSERDPFTLMRLIDVNILANRQLIDQCLKSGTRKVFAVSSDKAVNPCSLMGASKAFMERLFLSEAKAVSFSSARFANVAFSDGSLLHGFLRRIEKRQPLSGPSDIRRFFINHREAGELCLLSCFAGNNREVFVPRMEPEEYLMFFSEIAERVLGFHGYKAVMCDSEEEALERAAAMKDSERLWPCYFSASNTSGEKPFEEFLGNREEVDNSRYEAIRVITQPMKSGLREVEEACASLGALRTSGKWEKSALVDIIRSVVPELEYQDLGVSLDQKM